MPTTADSPFNQIETLLAEATDANQRLADGLRDLLPVVQRLREMQAIMANVQSAAAQLLDLSPVAAKATEPAAAPRATVTAPPARATPPPPARPAPPPDMIGDVTPAPHANGRQRHSISVIVSDTRGMLDQEAVHRALTEIPQIRRLSLTSYTRDSAVFLIETETPPAELPLQAALSTACPGGFDGRWVGAHEYVVTLSALVKNGVRA